MQPLCVKDFRHFYYCTSKTSIMNVIIPMDKNDIFFLTVFTEKCLHITHKNPSTNEQFVNNITLNKVHLPLGLQLNMHMMTISALHRIYTYTFIVNNVCFPNNTALMMHIGGL